MEQLGNAVQAAFEKMASEGRIEAIIQEKVEKTVDGVLDDTLRKYSDFGKNLENAVAKGLSVNFNDLCLQEYNAIVLKIVKAKLDEAVNTVGREKIARDLEELLGGTTPAEVTLTELIGQFKKWVCEDSYDPPSDEITLFLGDMRYSSRWIYLDPSANCERYKCRFSLLLREDGTVASLSFDGIDPQKRAFIGSLNGFSRTLFQMYAAGTRLVVDIEEHEADLYLERDGD